MILQMAMQFKDIYFFSEYVLCNIHLRERGRERERERRGGAYYIGATTKNRREMIENIVIIINALCGEKDKDIVKWIRIRM